MTRGAPPRDKRCWPRIPLITLGRGHLRGPQRMAHNGERTGRREAPPVRRDGSRAQPESAGQKLAAMAQAFLVDAVTDAFREMPLHPKAKRGKST